MEGTRAWFFKTEFGHQAGPFKERQNAETCLERHWMTESVAAADIRRDGANKPLMTNEQKRLMKMCAELLCRRWRA